MKPPNVHLKKLVMLSLANDSFRNHFTFSSKYFDILYYFKKEPSRLPIFLEVPRNDN